MKIAKPGGVKLDKFEESVSQVCAQCMHIGLVIQGKVLWQLTSVWCALYGVSETSLA